MFVSTIARGRDFWPQRQTRSRSSAGSQRVRSLESLFFPPLKKITHRPAGARGADRDAAITPRRAANVAGASRSEPNCIYEY